MEGGVEERRETFKEKVVTQDREKYDQSQQIFKRETQNALHEGRKFEMTI